MFPAPTRLRAGVRAGRFRLSLAVAAWLSAVALGSFCAARYANTPGPTRAASSRFPEVTLCRLSGESPTLILFAHPRCPCTRASLRELLVLVSRAARPFDAQVVFLQPKSGSDDWRETDLVRIASAIPGARVLFDVGAREQRQFGAAVSGEVFLYQPDGILRFHGGITSARGHEGDNAGRLILESLLGGQSPGMAVAPVYGCELDSRDCPAPHPGGDVLEAL